MRSRSKLSQPSNTLRHHICPLFALYVLVGGANTTVEYFPHDYHCASATGAVDGTCGDYSSYYAGEGTAAHTYEMQMTQPAAESTYPDEVSRRWRQEGTVPSITPTLYFEIVECTLLSDAPLLPSIRSTGCCLSRNLVFTVIVSLVEQCPQEKGVKYATDEWVEDAT